MLNQIKNFMLDESGLETVEWAVVGGLIVAATAGIFMSLGTNVFNHITALVAATV